MADDRKTPIYLLVDNAKEVTVAPGERGPKKPDKSDAPPDLPADCPVKPLGKYGQTCFYLDGQRQFIAMAPREHGHTGIANLFGPYDHLLEQYWPRKSLRKLPDEDEAKWVTTGWKPELAARALMRACAELPVWNPTERIRGRGAWPGVDGQLIYHAGDQVFDGVAWREPGPIGDFVYVGAEPIPKPWPSAVDRDVAGELLLLLRSWHWARPDLDPRLLLGWIGAALLSGALEWRPNCWVTGERNTGKSSLHRALRGIFGRGFVQVADASEAAIRRRLGHDALPVGFDELENRDDNRRQQAVIGFARLSASGSTVLRVAEDKTTTDFVARSCFLFSSIRMVGLEAQDRSRMAILALEELKSLKAPDIGEERMRKIGRQLLRRLMDQWGRYPQALRLYREALMHEGHSARGADVFGTLLAIADLLESDGEVDNEAAETSVLELAADRLEETADNESDAEMCLRHLSTTAIPRDGGGYNRRSVASFVRRAASDNENDNPTDASHMLQSYGMRVVARDARKLVAVANNHAELAKLFAGTQWATQSGARGVWAQSLRRLPEASNNDNHSMRFGDAAAKCVMFPLELMVGKDPDAMLERQPALNYR